MARVLVVGLDDASWDLLLPWIGNHELPTLAELMKTGVYEYLRSTIPMVTLTARPSLITGTNPGHGTDIHFISGSGNAWPCS